jgi:hypothetical protein
MAFSPISNFAARKAIENVSQILIAFSQLFGAGKSTTPLGAVRKTSMLTLSGFGKIVDAQRQQWARKKNLGENA